MLTTLEMADIRGALVRAEEFAETMNPNWYLWNGTRVSLEYKGEIHQCENFYFDAPRPGEICIIATYMEPSTGFKVLVESWGESDSRCWY